VPPYTLAQISKSGTAAIGAAATAVLGVLAGDSTAGRVLTVVAVVGTAVATYLVPNAPTSDAVAPIDAEVEPH
jgi:hypothetical protein